MYIYGLTIVCFVCPDGDDVKTAVLFLGVSFVLSPVLVSLTETVSTDTIYAMTTVTLSANLLCHPYTATPNRSCMAQVTQITGQVTSQVKQVASQVKQVASQVKQVASQVKQVTCISDQTGHLHLRSNRLYLGSNRSWLRSNRSRLRSNRMPLCVADMKAQFGFKSFSTSAPRLGNCLPLALRVRFLNSVLNLSQDAGLYLSDCLMDHWWLLYLHLI